MCYIISLEGNIASGKSTILDKIETNDRVRILQEPIQEWNTIQKNGKPILELFYEYPAKYAFEFQVLVYMSLYNAIKKQSENCEILIIERSLESNIFIFGQMLYDKGFISPTQFSILNYMYETYRIKTNKRVYLFIPYSICFCRVRIRNRQGEEYINGDYLKLLQKYHRNFFEKFPYDVLLENEKDIDNFIKFIC
jgi:deoxyadenosine/deoxycytidine kinase